MPHCNATYNGNAFGVKAATHVRRARKRSLHQNQQNCTVPVTQHFNERDTKKDFHVTWQQAASLLDSQSVGMF